jgi:chromosome segregation ATPase
MTQFHELKEEVLLLKESLMDERKKRHDTELQLAYEVEKSNILYQQADDLKLKLQEYRNEIEAWKTGHEEEVNRLLQEVAQERQHRLRAETELKMEAAKLEDLCCTLEQWRDEDKCERHQLEEKHIEREVGWKEQVEQQKGEVEKLKKMVEKYCHDVDEFRKFLSSENIMISGLWAEQLAEVRSITEKLESLNKASETKFKEIAQLKQCVSECDEAITKQTRGSCSIAFGKYFWKFYSELHIHTRAHAHTCTPLGHTTDLHVEHFHMTTDKPSCILFDTAFTSIMSAICKFRGLTLLP